jgi:hypothetical protein
MHHGADMLGGLKILKPADKQSINHEPSLLGGTHSFAKGDKDIGGSVEDAWVTNVIDAERGKLRTSVGRLKRQNRLSAKYNYVPPLVNGDDQNPYEPEKKS